MYGLAMPLRGLGCLLGLYTRFVLNSYAAGSETISRDRTFRVWGFYTILRVPSGPLDTETHTQPLEAHKTLKIVGCQNAGPTASSSVF